MKGSMEGSPLMFLWSKAPARCLLRVSGFGPSWFSSSTMIPSSFVDALAAMPSWNDGDTSSGSLLADFEYGPVDSPYELVPEMIYDPDFTGIYAGTNRCHHMRKLHKYVAFEGINTCRRFLGCGCQEEGICKKVDWVNGEWPHTMKKTLLRLWKLYDEEKDKRIQEGKESAQKILQDGTREEGVRKNDLQPAETAGQFSFSATSSIKKLEYYIADLLKAGEVNKEKLKKITQICEE